jgi:hypothetical protein
MGLFAHVKTNRHMGRFAIDKQFAQNITKAKNRVCRLAFGILQGFDRVKSPVTKPMGINKKNTLYHGEASLEDFFFFAGDIILTL